MNRLAIKIAGPAGFGIKSTGIALAKTFTRRGFNVFGYTEYPSLIRGGHNTYQVDLACQIHPERSEGSRGSRINQPIRSSSEKCDILIPLTLQALEKEIKNLNKESIIICDEKLELEKLNKLKNLKVQIIKTPLEKIAEKAGNKLMKNTVALGVLVKLLDLDIKKLEEVLQDVFGDKKEIGEQNIRAAREGHEWYKGEPLKPLKPLNKKEDNLYMTGNQATAMGIIASQCQLYVAYPMTPATDILHFLEAKQRETGIVVHQPEDEIAAIHAVLGASFAGARAACGTSGGGFALMNEGLSLAGQVELPAVIFEVQRPGPATGNPTWTEQGDLSYVINAGHGEFPKIVIAPGTPEQCFDLIQHAFNLADKFQTAVIVLSDKHLGESGFTVSKDVFDERIKNQESRIKNQESSFKRYQITKSGVSQRTIPGVENGEYIANSDEHNELSYSDESGEVRTAMMDKRMRKLEEIRKKMPLPKLYGPKNAEINLVCWGSVLGSALDSMNIFNTENTKTQKHKNTKINVIHFTYLWPLPKGLDNFLKKFRKLVLVENNYTGQLGKLIRQETGIEIKDRILKYDSRPFWREEIAKKIKNL